MLVADVDERQSGGQGRHPGRQRQDVLQGQVYVTGGDVITRIDGRTVSSNEQLVDDHPDHKPGDQVTVTVVQGIRHYGPHGDARDAAEGVLTDRATRASAARDEASANARAGAVCNARAGAV